MRYFILCLMIILFSSCEETTMLDLRQTPSQIVIEGLVTNAAGYQGVTLSRSADFYGIGKTPRIINANVKISDNQGKQVLLVHNPRSHPDSMGIYVPQNNFIGEVGITYTLRVEVEGQVYEGSDKLVSVIRIDSLKSQINALQAEDPKVFGQFYEVLLFAREPQEEENFYLFKFYRNDSLSLYNPTDIYYSNDALLAEKIDGVPSPVYYAPNDKARIEVYSLSRKGYVFYNDLFIVLNSDSGGMFGSIPSSPRTNLSNGALGFFQVSAMNEKELLIE